MGFTSTQNVKTYANNPEILADKTGNSGQLFDELQAGAFNADVVTTTTQQAPANASYIANNAGLVTVTLPATASVGSRVRVIGLGAGGWRVAQNANQLVHKSGTATTTGTGGSLSSSNRYNAVELVCVVANTEWDVVSSEGTLTLV